MQSRYFMPAGKMIFLILIVLFLLQGVPLLTHIDTLSSYTVGINNLGAIISFIQPLLLLWISFALLRILIVLEKIAIRLEQNKMNVNLTLKKDY